MTIIRMKHIRQCGYCSRGVRKFFERHSLDWQAFLKNGIDAKELSGINDAMMQKAIEAANGKR